MKIKRLDDPIGNKIEISGEIEEDFVLRVGVTVTFAEGATFKGKFIKAGTKLCNKEYVLKTFDISPEGELVLVPFTRPGTPCPGVRIDGLPFESSDEEGFSSEDISVAGYCSPCIIS